MSDGSVTSESLSRKKTNKVVHQKTSATGGRCAGWCLGGRRSGAACYMLSAGRCTSNVCAFKFVGGAGASGYTTNGYISVCESACLGLLGRFCEEREQVVLIRAVVVQKSLISSRSKGQILGGVWRNGPLNVAAFDHGLTCEFISQEGLKPEQASSIKTKE